MLASLFRSRSVRPISYGCVGRSSRRASTARARGLETFRAIRRRRIYANEYTGKMIRNQLKLQSARGLRELVLAAPGLSKVPDTFDPFDHARRGDSRCRR